MSSESPQALATYDPGRMTPLAVADIKQHVALIEELVASVLTEGVHYGKVQGVDKPFLQQPGAEVLGLTFNTRPKYTIESSIETEEHVQYVIRCDLVSKADETLILGSALGACSTRENKYCRTTRKVVSFKATPEEKAAMIEGTEEKKKKGSNTWTEWLIPASPFELCQTILAMAQKRAFVAAQRNMGAASQFFNIDEDIVQDQGWNSRGGASSSGGGRKSGGGSRSTKAKPMSGRQAEFVQDLAKKASLAGADLNAYCETKFKKPYFEYLGSEDGPDKDAIEAKRKEGFLVTDDGWLYPLMSEEASVLLDDLKEGKVEKAQVEEAQTE